MTHTPKLIIPTLIQQPTWGGEYIARTKGILEHEAMVGTILGQSYELYEHTMLSAKQDGVEPSFMLGESSKPEEATLYAVDDTPLKIQDLIKSDRKGVLGKSGMKLGRKINTLIKLTQAKGNSYQIHVRTDQKTDAWKVKPESWYFFQDGIVTLGVVPGADWDGYEQACKAINTQAKALSAQITHDNLPVAEARELLKAYILSRDVSSYVNKVVVKAGQAVDLSNGGVHHSWEEDEELCPNGNVLYEVQKNTYDPVATIRSFDKGKMKDDGSIRALQVDDYFKYVDRREKVNDPASHMSEPTVLFSSNVQAVSRIFDCHFYVMDELSIGDSMQSKYTDTTEDKCFHHLYAHKGDFRVQLGGEMWKVSQGWSIFVPASIGLYRLVADKSGTRILKTFVRGKS